MSEIDPIVAAGTVIASFVAGSGIFYALGRHTESNRLKPEMEREQERSRQHLASIRSLNDALEDARVRLRNLENDRVPPPPREQANQLVQTLLHDDDEVWLSSPPDKPPGHDDRIAAQRMKVISIANLKGGVGKTTTTANLAAYFDRHLNKRVLVIDADYQGSLSAIFKTMARTSEAPASTARWLSGTENLDLAAAGANRINDDLPNTRFLSAFYELSNVETRLMVQWLLGKMLKEANVPDLRYALGRALHSHAVTSRFDVVLIDCPPRLSTATINALCASTHLLIPTVPDTSSLEAAANFIKMSRRVTAQLNPLMRLAGVAPTLTSGTNLSDDEANLLRQFKARAKESGDEPYILQRHIPRNRPIASLAGTGIALMRASAPTKRLFSAFGDEVANRVGFGSTSHMAVAAE